MAKYLVTGGCGFIGSHLVDLLLEKGHSVSILDDLSHGTKKYLSQRANLYIGSILDPNLLKEALKGVDGVFHLAAMISVPDSIENWFKNHLINCAGSVQIMEHTRGIPFIYASSCAIYGDQNAAIQKESLLPNPLSPYALDKLTCERQLQLACQLYETPSLAFRFFNVYGPRQNPQSPYSGVISRFTSLIKNNQPITIYGDGHQCRDFVYVKDVVNILAASIASPLEGAHVYNICTGVATSINQLTDLIGQLSQSKIQKEHLPARKGDILFSVGDPSKLLNEKGLQASTPLARGIEDLLPETY